MSTIYDGVASIGKIKATIGLIGAVILCVVLYIFGFYLETHANNHTQAVTGTVISCNCTVSNKSQTCTIVVGYVVNGKPLSGMVTSPISYSAGSPIAIKYDPKNPGDVQIPQISNATIGFIFMGIGTFAVVSASVYFYLVSNFKPLAALQGASTIEHVLF